MDPSRSTSNSATNINVGELLRFSNEITKVNNLKIEKELLLHQLALFKSLTGLVKARPKNINTVFQLEFSIDPCYHSPGSNNVGSMLNLSEYETLKISVTNISKGFTFDPKFWSILIQYEEGKVHVWNLQNTLKAGETETFCTQFYPTFNNNMKQHRNGDNNEGREKIEVSLVFSLQWTESSYTKSFHIKSMYLDILYFINPGRRTITTAASNNSHVLLFSSTNDNNGNKEALPTKLDNDYQQQNGGTTTYREEESITKKLPPVCRFNLKTDDKLHKRFIQDVFLRDCNFTRGFNIGENPNNDSKTIIIDTDVILREPTEYHAYFHEERIIFSKHDDNIISFRCSNPSILQLIKDAIYRRLLKLCETRQVKLKCKGQDQIQDFYDTKLKFEALRKSTLSEKDAYAELLGIYYNLRECSESMIYFAYD